MDLIEAMRTRRACRAYLDQPVSEAQISDILDAARWAPSGVNMQPWRVEVLYRPAIDRLATAIVAARSAEQPANPDYAYYPATWFDPYRSRRRATGLALYGALGIGREDRQAQQDLWNSNYRFFGAPVGLLLFIDRELGQGSWIDYGMFIQNILLAATAAGLGSCPQAAFADYPDIAREQLAIEPRQALICGIALGYADPQAAANHFRTEREPVEHFTHFHR